MGGRTIGILYPGEMGTAIGAVLRDSGHTIVTTLEGRSTATEVRCREANFRVLDSIEQVLESASIILSFVHPNGALDLLNLCIETLSRRAAEPDRPIYVDGNSIAPATALTLAELCASRQVDFVDASIHGNSTQLRERSVLYLSGPRAGSVAETFAGSMRSRNLGDNPTQASRFKMTIAGVSKGASALLMEVASFAAQQGILTEWLEDCRHFYPDLMDRMETMLPSYAEHSGRRAQELRDMTDTVRDAGLQPGMLAGAQTLVARLAAQSNNPVVANVKHSQSPLDDFLAALGSLSLLDPPTTTASPGIDKEPRTPPGTDIENSRGAN